MEFPFDINALLPERISLLDHNLCAGRRHLGRPDFEEQIATVIDELGKASAKAQQLAAPITSALKLQTNRHHLYLLKEGESNGGRGVVVGFLKVGYKKLFILDHKGAHLETEPLCVLDFYVTESLQRHGYGLELFSYMLHHKRVEPAVMAFDRPSPKLLSFLEKHYSLKNSVPQVNNFAVFDGFFRNHSVVQLRKLPPKKPEGEIKPYSLTEREVLREEQKVLPWPFTRPGVASPSPSRCLSVGSSPSHTPPRTASGQYRGQSAHSQLIDSVNCRARRTSEQGLVARDNLYSRHLSSRGLGPTAERTDRLPSPHGMQPETETETERGETTLEHTDIDRPPPLVLPPVPVSRVSTLTPVEVTQGSGAGGGGSEVPVRGVRGTWSWTVGRGPWTAQWVRRKQEARSTRPW